MSETRDKDIDNRPPVMELLSNIKSNLAALRELETRCQSMGDDGVYRFYHGSFKVYGRLQPVTLAITTKFRELSPTPEQPLDPLYEEIISAGTSYEFELAQNAAWSRHARPVVEAYFHARWFLTQHVLASQLEFPPNLLPEGWAAVLTLYNLR